MKFKYNFITFSIFFYSIIALTYGVNYEPYLLIRVILPLIFIFLFLYKNKYTWIILIFLLAISIITYTLPCRYPITSYIYSYLCASRPFEVYIYLSRFIPLEVTSFFYKMIYLLYLFSALIILSLKKYRNMYCNLP